LRSYRGNSELLVQKVLPLLAGWAQGGARNRAVLCFHGVVRPLVQLYHLHAQHPELLRAISELLLTMAQDPPALMIMLRAGLLVALATRAVEGDGANGEGQGGGEGPLAQQARQLEASVVRLLSRVVCGVAPEQVPAMSTDTRERLLSLLEHALGAAPGAGEAHELLSGLSKLAPASWYTEQRTDRLLRAVSDVVEAAAAQGGDVRGAWALVRTLLERAFDVAGAVREPLMARLLAKDAAFHLLEALTGNDLAPEQVQCASLPDRGWASVLISTWACVVLSQAPGLVSLWPPFLVKHSGCQVDDAVSMSATLGGSAGEAFGFGAYGLGPCIPGKSRLSSVPRLLPSPS
jgi:hypothetical protein